MRYVIVGGTGLIGTKVAALLAGRGDVVVVAAPSTGVDSVTGRGLRAALAEADVVVDVTRPHSYAAAEVMDFFLTSTRNLLAAEADAGVSHHVVLSVVGAEHLLASSWFRAKIVQENLVRSGPVPYTVVRATQFFEFVARIADHEPDATEVRLPPVRCQPMAADDVAAAVASIAGAHPGGDLVEVAGPELFLLPDLVSRVLGTVHDDRTVVVDRNGRYFGAQLEEATLLPGPGARLGTIRFADWLARPRSDTD